MQFKRKYGVWNLPYFGLIPFNDLLLKIGLISLLWSIDGVVTTPLCAVDEFDSQVQHLRRSEMLTPAEAVNFSAVFYDLQDTLQTIWPGSEILPLGSIVTGLATKFSDADCMVKLPNSEITSDVDLILQAATLLKRHPLLYNQITPKVNPTRRIPLLKFNYLPTNRNCDVNFISDFGLQNSLMMGYYFNLDEKFLNLAIILKYWSKVHELRSTDTLASNTLNLLIIFYLQQENLVPPFYFLQKRLVIYPTSIWMSSFKMVQYNSTISRSLYELLGGFFKYYSNFNFEEYVVSPLLGRPILKKAFEKIDSLPEELFLYKNYMRQPNSRPLVTSTKLCVQDPIEQRRNTAIVPDSKANKFIAHVRFAAQMFNIVPKDFFLKVILDKKSSKLSFRQEIHLNEIIRVNYCVTVNTS